MHTSQPLSFAPDHESRLLEDFFAKINQPIEIENKLSALLDQLQFKEFVINISHSDYLTAVGGTEKVQQEEQIEFIQHGISYLHIYPLDSGEVRSENALVDQVVGVNIDGTAGSAYTLRELAMTLHLLSVEHVARPVAIHVHHMIRFSLPGLHYFLKSLECKLVRFFLHDYFTLCPQFNLLRNDTSFCGAPLIDTPSCGSCRYSARRICHVQMIHQILHALPAEFIAPSEIVADIWRRSYPDLAAYVRVIPHQKTRPGPRFRVNHQLATDPDYLPRLAFLGNDHPFKGALTWRRLVSNPAITNRYRFFHLGTLQHPMQEVTHVPVSINQDGPLAMVQAIKDHKIDIALLWSIWPETYSFTVFEAFAGGCFVLANTDGGNIATQVRLHDRGIVLDDEQALIHFLQEDDAVKERLRHHITTLPPFTLNFNDQIVLETLNFLNFEGTRIDEAAHDIVHCILGGSIWKSLRHLFIIESLRSDHIHLLTEAARQAQLLKGANQLLQNRVDHLQSEYSQLESGFQEMEAGVRETIRKFAAMEIITPQHVLIVRLNSAVTLLNHFLQDKPILSRLTKKISTIINKLMDIAARFFITK